MAVVTIDGPAHDDLQGFSAGARRALLLAEREARSLGHERVGTEHVLLGLLADDGAAAAVALQEAGASLATARRKVLEAVGPGAPAAGDPTSSPRAARAIGRAPRFARDQGADVVGSDHLLLAVLDVEGTAGQVLRGLGVDIEQLRTALDARASTSARDEDPPPAPVPPACPSCHAPLTSVTAAVVPMTGDASGDVTVLSCPACGAILGSHLPP